MKRTSIFFKKGFTLVELLIVVSIIGVLATIGVPTFRTMSQKARKSEAKMALGALFTAETGFFSEYGYYGSVMDKMGFELEGNQASRTYAVGFLDTNCNLLAGTTVPDPASIAGSSLNLAFPSYYLGTANFGYTSPKATGGNCGVLSANLANSVTIGDFVAGAAGQISPTGVTDVWSINRFRNLTNAQDGVTK